MEKINQSASITEFINKMKEIEERIIHFFDSDPMKIDFLENLKINEDKPKLKEFLRLFSHISCNYHHSNDFFNKVEQIIIFYLEDIKKNFTESEIFHIFNKNKRILLFLFEKKILLPNKKIYKIFSDNQYENDLFLNYFYPEFKPFIEKKFNEENEENLLMFHAYYNLNGKPYEISRKESSNDPVLFNEKRKIGENDDHICELIRKDLLDDFILYVNKFNVCLTKKIETPFYETNPFLLKGKNHKIIEYAAFFGSIRIFKYLLLKKKY